jgi:spore maturation protein CgeB
LTGFANVVRVLYVGSDSGTSRHRALALQRLGHQVSIIDPRRLLPGGRALNYWIHHTGALFLGSCIERGILKEIGECDFNLVWVDNGSLISPSLVRQLKRRYTNVVNYNLDDPYGTRDGKRWRLYLQSAPFYDSLAVVRDCNVLEAKAAGARNVFRVHRSADETAHAPREITDADHATWASEVAFIGTWMPERGPLLERLLKLGIPLTIYGDRWGKAKEWPILRSHWRGGVLHEDNDYAKAVQCAKVCLGLLSKGNRDLTTQRSFEIPHLGSVLCAERTAEHADLYREDEEAVFWETPEECAEKCLRLLRDEQLRKQIARRGRHRCLQNRTTNEAVLRELLSNMRAD